MREHMDLYRVNVFGVPFKNHTVVIKDLPAYLMADASTASRTEEVVFQAIEAHDLNQCTTASAIWFLTRSRCTRRQPLSRTS
ncbi:hypothetical protein DPMN_159387 [Dreissena polymorpha]|uniref:Uncharacterized protein n=1 Tax=Dreissena polymorpha TaxID=45954 RepID=A0A9D4ENA1_DREPO|nr:hypothetical protein DPMN_159387 [Dreissena polymorpha]